MIGLLATGIALPDAGRSRPGGRRAPIADQDEDVVTLAVEAAERCLAGRDRSLVAALHLATTSSPFAERSTAALVARILGLPGEVRAADFAGSLRSGTDALLAAFSTARAGDGSPVLVVASEVRRPGEGSRDAERTCDAAVAFLVGEGEPSAVLKAATSTTGRALGPMRRSGESTVRPAAGALFGSLGYGPAVTAAVKLLFTRHGYSPASFRYVLLDSPDGHCHLRPAVDLGVDVDVQLPADALVGLGHAGTVHPFLLLAWALPRCEAGEEVLLVSWGEGASALALEITPGVLGIREDQPFRTALTSVRELPRGEARLRWRRSPAESDHRVAARAAGDVHEGFVPLTGWSCSACGAVIAIPFAVCPSCRERDSAQGMDLGRSGIVYTSTLLHGFPGRSSPLALAVVDLLGGGRVLVQVAGTGQARPAIGSEVALVLRRLYDSPRGPIYHYKAKPMETAP